ncbi:hypothetical protein C8J57DRAFT_1073393, partial [Mycena rebaudengoi]
ILHITRSIISGSLPLAILTGGTFIPNDMDIFVPCSQEQTMLALLEIQYGCIPTASVRGQNYINSEVANVRWLSTTDSAWHINLMTCTGECPVSALWHFHSTLVMNFISSKGIYSAYPKLTLHHWGILSASFYSHSLDGHCRRKSIIKYRKRGFSFRTSLDITGSRRRHVCFRDLHAPSQYGLSTMDPVYSFL